MGENKNNDNDINAVNACLDQLSAGTKVTYTDLVIMVKRKLNDWRAEGRPWPYQSDRDIRGVCKDVAGMRTDLIIAGMSLTKK